MNGVIRHVLSEACWLIMGGVSDRGSKGVVVDDALVCIALSHIIEFK